MPSIKPRLKYDMCVSHTIFDVISIVEETSSVKINVHSRVEDLICQELGFMRRKANLSKALTTENLFISVHPFYVYCLLDLSLSVCGLRLNISDHFLTFVFLCH